MVCCVVLWCGVVRWGSGWLVGWRCVASENKNPTLKMWGLKMKLIHSHRPSCLFVGETFHNDAESKTLNHGDCAHPILHGEPTTGRTTRNMDVLFFRETCHTRPNQPSIAASRSCWCGCQSFSGTRQFMSECLSGVCLRLPGSCQCLCLACQ